MCPALKTVGFILLFVGGASAPIEQFGLADTDPCHVE